MRECVVISGVNLVDLGPLTIFREALESLVQSCGDRYQIVALVHKSDPLRNAKVTFLEFPHIKGSWLRRMQFEYFESLKISRQLNPVLWIAMHDMTPRVRCKKQVVYCHNPSPFYGFSLREAILDPKFGMFTVFYRFLYRLFIHRNCAVIVQQDWIRTEFTKRYHVRNVIVAKPSVEIKETSRGQSPSPQSSSYIFFYPAFPRTFKNHELLLRSVQLLEARGISGFEVLLTVDATSNRCGADLYKRYSKLESVRWLGSLSRARVFEIYDETQCLVFPSKLETWGLPLSEFKVTGKPILAVDLPYAHETIGDYDRVSFVNERDAAGLAAAMERAINGTEQWQQVRCRPIAEPYARDWQALWLLLFPAI